MSCRRSCLIAFRRAFAPAALLAGLLNPGAAAAQPAQEGQPVFRSVAIPENQEPPAMDGRIDEEVWGLAEPMTGFIQQDPQEGAPATEKTEVRVLYDRSNLYIGVVAYDSSPDQIVVTQSRRDASLNDSDSIQVVLDTFNDSQNGFVFGTNPMGIEYDGQVANEGVTGGFSRGAGSAGSARGQISGFNPNWDGDWTVRSAITERGWETEMAIPLKTLRYATGSEQTWGFNVMRNIRRKNEQVYLAPIPRGYNLHRVSMAAKLTGLDLRPRRDIKMTPFVLGSVNKDYTVTEDQLDSKGDVGLDVKWGVRPNLTLDLTVNTDFAQVEADEEQVNLTRFPLFFPEKRGFFLENASTFQFGAPQQIDLFFSRRVGLSPGGIPIGIIAGARLSGKIGNYNVGLLNMQTEKTTLASGQLVAPGNNFSVARIQREFGRSNVGAIFVNRQGVGSAAGDDNYNRAYGLDANLQVSQNGKLFTFLARTDSPGARGSDYAGRVLYQFTNDLWNLAAGYSQVGDDFNPEVGFLPRRGYRRPEFRAFWTPQPKNLAWVRRFFPHVTYNGEWGFDGEKQSSRAHIHPFEIQMANGGRFGFWWDRIEDAPTRDFVVYSNSEGRRIVIPPGLYGWTEFNANFISDPSAPFFYTVQGGRGGFYDGDSNSIQLEGGMRIGSTFVASTGWTRQNIELPGGDFTTDLVPVKVGYSFTTLMNVQALIQYNSQAELVSSNIRFAALDRSGTGLFIVFNDRRDTTSFTPLETLGRSFIVKYTRLFDF